MIAAIHLTAASQVAILVLLVFCFLLLIFAAIEMYVERCPERDEDEELESYYAQFRRLPL